MAIRTLAALMIGVLLANRISAQQHDRAAKAETTNRFEIAGVKIGSTLEQVRNAIPALSQGMAPGTDKPNANHFFVELNNTTDFNPIANFYLKAGIVSSIEIEYDRECMSAIEMKQPILELIEQRFGKPTKIINGEERGSNFDVYVWQNTLFVVTFSRFHEGTGLFCERRNLPTTSYLGVGIPEFTPVATFPAVSSF